MTMLNIGDPRFGMRSPIPQGGTTRMPSGLARTGSATRTATLADPLNLLSLTQLTETATLNGRTGTSLYDAATRTFTSTSPFGRTSTLTIDTLGRQVAGQVTGLALMSYQYDARGRLVQMTAGTGAEARTTTFTYTPESYVETITDSIGRVTRFTYDGAGRTLTQALPDLRIITFTYDANGNLATLTPPSKPAHAFSYSPVDLETTYDPPDAGLPEDRTQVTYNIDRQTELMTRPDGQTVDPTYDPAGRLSALAFSRGSLALSTTPPPVSSRASRLPMASGLLIPTMAPCSPRPPGVALCRAA